MRKSARYFYKIAFPTLGVVWASSYYLEVYKKSLYAKALIQPVYILIVLGYIVLCYTEYKKIHKEGMQAEEHAPNVAAQIPVVLLSCCYLVFLKFGGFLLTTPIFLFGCFRFLGEENKRHAVMMAAGFTVIVWFVFKVLLSVALPTGFLRY